MNLNTNPPSTQETRYLAQLAAELTSVPKQYRADVLDGIQTHIHDALERADSDLGTILHQLGTPSIVAAQAMQDLVEESDLAGPPLVSHRNRRLQIWAFALALLVVLMEIFLSPPHLTVKILPSFFPPLALTLIPLLTRGPNRHRVSAICTVLLTIFLLTALILSFTLSAFAYPVTLLLIPTQTMVFIYIPMLALAVIPLIGRRQ
ncbi:HAAS signaling domain-containing protein [Cryobacterium lyxosi]|uniref:DUF1700 domain-containing protein n=1 Tax=Cryobacterium lyxosi TaxID=1259228 RepID=A0A4R8ZG28_9MICO|nr:hypothetical protein [Cryobacterium lyxosi]TFD25086.1 hypothetical protein E3T27_09875 [Cryobacterium lyxosi]